MILNEQIMKALKNEDGLTDRQLRELLGKDNQSINQSCHQLEEKGKIIRIKEDGIIHNYINKDGGSTVNSSAIVPEKPDSKLQEDEVKRLLQRWLDEQGFSCDIAWGRKHGIDIEAKKENCRWIIEVKGCGSRNPMRVNYFLAVITEDLQRMDDGNAKYSIALPDIKQFRNLWKNFPDLAKKRTGISCLFVNEKGDVEEIF